LVPGVVSGVIANIAGAMLVITMFIVLVTVVVMFV